MAPLDEFHPRWSAEERAHVLDRAHAAQAMSRSLLASSRDSALFHARVLSDCLESATQAHDRHPTPARYDRLVRLCNHVGRSVEIERAKAIIADQQGVDRVQAWDLLRRLSQHSNRPVRAVAHELVTRARTP
jgi:hypothetical protein